MDISSVIELSYSAVKAASGCGCAYGGLLGGATG